MIKEIEITVKSFEVEGRYFEHKAAAELYDQIPYGSWVRLKPDWEKVLASIPNYRPRYVGCEDEQDWKGGTHPSNIQKFVEATGPGHVVNKMLNVRFGEPFYGEPTISKICLAPSKYEADELYLMIYLNFNYSEKGWPSESAAVPVEICELVSPKELRLWRLSDQSSSIKT